MKSTFLRQLLRDLFRNAAVVRIIAVEVDPHALLRDDRQHLVQRRHPELAQLVERHLHHVALAVGRAVDGEVVHDDDLARLAALQVELDHFRTLLDRRPNCNWRVLRTRRAIAAVRAEAVARHLRRRPDARLQEAVAREASRPELDRAPELRGRVDAVDAEVQPRGPDRVRVLRRERAERRHAAGTDHVEPRRLRVRDQLRGRHRLLLEIDKPQRRKLGILRLEVLERGIVKGRHRHVCRRKPRRPNGLHELLGIARSVRLDLRLDLAVLRHDRQHLLQSRHPVVGISGLHPGDAAKVMIAHHVAVLFLVKVRLDALRPLRVRATNRLHRVLGDLVVPEPPMRHRTDRNHLAVPDGGKQHKTTSQHVFIHFLPPKVLSIVSAMAPSAVTLQAGP